MTNTQTTNGRVSILTAATAALLFAAPISSAFAQGAPTQAQARWMPYSGCWVPEANAAVGANAITGTMVCIVPVAGTQSADVATIVNKQVLHSNRVVASGARIDKTIDKCPGWESATWSDDGRRLLMRSEFACGDSIKVKGSGVFSVNANGDWIHVQGSTVGANANSRVVRYRPADVALAPNSVLTDSAFVTTVAADNGFAMLSVRQAAGAPPTINAVLNVSKSVEEPVAQAWLAELGKPEKLDAKGIVAMSDAGMPSSLIDLMVAMSYPERFQLQANAGGEPRPVNANFQTDSRPSCNFDVFDRYDLMYGSRYNQANCVNRYGSMYGVYPFGYLSGWRNGWGNYGYGYGDGYGRNYYGNSPIVIVVRGSEGDATAQPRGRAVRGGGYTRDTGGSSSTPRTTSSGSSNTGARDTGGSSSSSGGASSGGSSGGEARTAKPRTPPGN